jgi:hypothetical protein
VAEADGPEEVRTCERCGKVRPAGWTCACGGEGQAAPAPAALAERDPATTRSERPRLRLVARPPDGSG